MTASKLLSDFRQELELLRGNDLDFADWLEFFPGATCVNVTTMAAKFLHENCNISRDRIAGAFNADHSSGVWHSWLLVDGLIYDLTVDQFEGVDGPIMGVAHSTYHDVHCPNPSIFDYQETAGGLAEDWMNSHLIPTLDLICTRIPLE